MPPPRDSAKLTRKDLSLLPDDGRRHELIDGAHYVTPAPSRRHQSVSLRLTLAIGGFLQQHPVGQLLVAPFEVALSQYVHQTWQPDLLFVRAEREEILAERRATGAPDLVIEILSPSTRRRDRELKRKTYERFGVAEYWIVDPDAGTVRVLRLEDGEYRNERELSAANGDHLETPLLPGLTIPLTEALAPRAHPPSSPRPSRRPLR